MSNPAASGPRRPYAPGVMLPMLLAIALLIPVGVLFGQVWRNVDRDSSSAARERDGITYLRALGPLAAGLVDAQSAAVTGQQVQREPLTRAVQETAAVDARLGNELRTQERWASLRSKIEALPDRNLNGAADALTVYGEAADLLLALCDKVRISSGLERDPDPDSAQLQFAAARDLPTGLVAAGRLADTVAIAPSRPSSDRLNTVADLTKARMATLDPVGDVVTDLQTAIDSTQSTELGGHLLSKFDRYQQAMAALALASAPPASTPPDAGTATKQSATADQSGSGSATKNARLATPDPAKVAIARVDAQAATVELSIVVLTELDTLITARVDRMDTQRWLALSAAAAAALIALAVLAGTIITTARRRATAGSSTDKEPDTDNPGSGTKPPRPPAGGPVGVQRRWEPPAERSELVPAGPNSRPAASGATVRDNQPANWGPTDAAR